LSIQHLVPGVVVPLRSSSTLREVVGSQKLDAIKVVEENGKETITITLSPFNHDDAAGGDEGDGDVGGGGDGGDGGDSGPSIVHATGQNLFTGPEGLYDIFDVGTNPLMDSSDSSYVQIGMNNWTANYALTLLDSYTPGDAISLHIRCQVSVSATSPSDDWRSYMQLSTEADGDPQVGGFSDGTGSNLAFHIPASGPNSAANEIVELVIPIRQSPWPYTNDDIGAMLVSGPLYLSMQFLYWDGDNTPDWFRVYEAWIEVGP
jgi:hypothetical protein